MKYGIAILFALLVFTACLFVLRLTLTRIQEITKQQQEVFKPLAVTIGAGSLIMTILTVFGMCVLEYVSRTPNWHVVVGWSCVSSLIYLVSFLGTAVYQINKKEGVR